MVFLRLFIKLLRLRPLPGGGRVASKAQREETNENSKNPIGDAGGNAPKNIRSARNAKEKKKTGR